MKATVYEVMRQQPPRAMKATVYEVMDMPPHVIEFDMPVLWSQIGFETPVSRNKPSSCHPHPVYVQNQSCTDAGIVLTLHACILFPHL